MRLKIKVIIWDEDEERIIKTLFRYDIGVRAIDDRFNRLDKYIKRLGKDEPRFLEDWIEEFGRDNVKVISWGKYKYLRSDKFEELNRERK